MANNPDRQTDRQLDNCSFVKGVLLLIILFSHSVVFWRADWFTAVKPKATIPGIDAVVDFVSNFHVYAFTLVSGYIFSCLIFEKNKYTEYGKFIFNKTKRLIVPYLCVGFLWVLPFQAYFFKVQYLTLAKKLVLGQANAQLWYIFMLFWIFALLWPLSSYIRKNNALALLVGIMAYALSFVIGKVLPYDFELTRAFTHIPMFIIGMKIRQYKDKNLLKWKSALFLGVCYTLLFCIKGFLDGKDGLAVTVFSIGATFLLRCSGAMGAFALLQLIGDKVHWKKSLFWMKYISNSMVIYLLHQQLIYCSIWVLNGINPMFHCAINFVFSFVLSFALSMALTKYRATRFLVGC